MAPNNKKSKADWLVGQWQAGDGQISVLFIIDRKDKNFRIQAFDESDGEKLMVSKIKWDGKNLAFETLTPSNKWRTKNRIKAVSKTRAIQELTHWEPWKKVAEKASG